MMEVDQNFLQLEEVDLQLVEDFQREDIHQLEDIDQVDIGQEDIGQVDIEQEDTELEDIGQEDTELEDIWQEDIELLVACCPEAGLSSELLR